MGSIYSFHSKGKPWIKVGHTINCPIGRIDDYNATHGTDFDSDTKFVWDVPDVLCLHIEQLVHLALEERNFDRVRKGSANEIFSYAGRNALDALIVVEQTIDSTLRDFNYNMSRALESLTGNPVAQAMQVKLANKTVSSEKELLAEGKCPNCHANLSPIISDRGIQHCVVCGYSRRVADVLEAGKADTKTVRCNSCGLERRISKYATGFTCDRCRSPNNL
jgi:uncharacterized Zn finger protein